MYRIESAIVERFKEQDLNVDDLLQAHANVKKHKIKKIEENILHAVDNLNEKINLLHELRTTTNEEIIQLLEDAGMVVDRNKND